MADNIIQFIHKREKTCRNSCAFFDNVAQACPFYENISFDDPVWIFRCLEYTEPLEVYDENDILGDDSFEFNISGAVPFDYGNSNYPFKPDFPIDKVVPELKWYLSPDESFGCWVKNDCSRPMPLKKKRPGWVQNKVYEAPVPFHDHKASLNLRSRICWYVDRDGFGQYTLILANQVRVISFPKPPSWVNK